MEKLFEAIGDVQNNQLFMSPGILSEDVPYFIHLDNFKKEVSERRSWIEESMLSGDFDVAKRHLACIGSELVKLYNKLEEIEKKDKEDCGCIQNITKEEFESYLKSIGGLENGYGGRYWGDNKIRKFFFNITDWIIWKLPYFKESKKFSNKGPVRLFFRHMFYYMLKPILKDQKPNNPFRSMICEAGYFSVGPGWYGLLKKLIEETINKKWDKNVYQVKQKYGGLRFYINSAPKEVHDIIHKYENMSYDICEYCGESGQVRSGGWIETLCNKCYEEHSKN